MNFSYIRDGISKLIGMSQASKSRAAQQALSELEKSSAQFEDQLVEAAKFIGSELDAVSTSASRQNERKDLKKVPTSHGKEEWLLKWLLKKLQAPKDDVPRYGRSVLQKAVH